LAGNVTFYCSLHHIRPRECEKVEQQLGPKSEAFHATG